MLDLHKTDRLILCELDCDSRVPLSAIGKKARISKESVHYRIQQLEKRGIIKGYPSIVSLAKRGKIHAEIFLRFHNVTVPLRKEMVDYFCSRPEVINLALCKGSWDLLMGVVVDSITGLNDFKNSISDAYSMYFADLSVSLTIETYFFGRKYLVGKHIHQTQHIDKPGDEKTDGLDERIIGELARDARQSLIEIGKKAGSNAKTVAYRMKRMEKAGVLQKYTLALDLEKLGMTTFKLLIRLKDSSHKKSLLEYFHHQQNTVNVREVLSEWNLEPTFEVGSQEEFYAIVKEIEEQFGESIMSHTSLMLDMVYKTAFYN